MKFSIKDFLIFLCIVKIFLSHSFIPGNSSETIISEEKFYGNELPLP